LTIGFGPNRAEVGDVTAVTKGNGYNKTAVLDFDYTNTSPSLSVPAGSIVTSVTLYVTTAWVTLTSLEVGLTGGDTDAYLTAIAAASLLADTVFSNTGVELDNENSEPFASADTIDVLYNGSAPTAGAARLVVEYRARAA
jgi:hypothetical protein